MAMTKQMILLLMGSIACGITGCGANARHPQIDAAAAGKAAIAKFDANGDAVLSGKELDRISSIGGALDKFDANGDKQVSADEISARIESWQASPNATATVSCNVRFGGRPVVDATVELEPESFLGDQVQPARGTTNEQGFAYLSMATDDPSAPTVGSMQYGLYRVRITKSTGGIQAIPVKYNSDTKLGLEVAPDSQCVREGAQFVL